MSIETHALQRTMIFRSELFDLWRRIHLVP